LVRKREDEPTTESKENQAPSLSPREKKEKK